MTNVDTREHVGQSQTHYTAAGRPIIAAAFDTETHAGVIDGVRVRPLCGSAPKGEWQPVLSCTYDLGHGQAYEVKPVVLCEQCKRKEATEQEHLKE